MNQLKLVVVSYETAGERTLQKMLKLSPKLCDITVFGDQPHPNGKRIRVSPELKRLKRATTAPESPTPQAQGKRARAA